MAMLGNSQTRDPQSHSFHFEWCALGLPAGAVLAIVGCSDVAELLEGAVILNPNALSPSTGSNLFLPSTTQTMGRPLKIPKLVHMLPHHHSI